MAIPAPERRVSAHGSTNDTESALSQWGSFAPSPPRYVTMASGNGWSVVLTRKYGCQITCN